jgi:hypothetical protein
MPSATGTPSSSEIVTTSSTGSTATCVNRALVSASRLPQNAKFSGVITVAMMVDTAVMPIDSIVLPLAMWVMKLEMLPPGHDPTRIMPSAISWCMSLKCIRPGAHMCLTGSTSTWMTAGPPLAIERSIAALELAWIGYPLAVGAHRAGEIVEADLAEVGLDGLVGPERLPDQRLDRLEA